MGKPRILDLADRVELAERQFERWLLWDFLVRVLVFRGALSCLFLAGMSTLLDAIVVQMVDPSIWSPAHFGVLVNVVVPMLIAAIGGAHTTTTYLERQFLSFWRTLRG